MRFRKEKVHAKAVASSVSTSDIERDFYNEWAVGDRYYWWICLIMVDPNEIIVKDDLGNLYRMVYTTTTDGQVGFGEPIDVKMEFVDAPQKEAVEAVVAGIVSARGEKIAAKYTSREESRLNVEGDPMREKIAKLRAKLGLGADISDEEVLARSLTALEAVPDPVEDPALAPTADPDDDEDDPATPATPAIPEGAVMVDARALASLQADAGLGRSAHEELTKTKHEAEIAACIKSGKIPRTSQESYLAQMKRDPEGTRAFLATLADNVIPVALRGQEPGDDTPGIQAGATDAWLAARMPDVAARKAKILASGAATSLVMTDK